MVTYGFMASFYHHQLSNWWFLATLQHNNDFNANDWLILHWKDSKINFSMLKFLGWIFTPTGRNVWEKHEGFHETIFFEVCSVVSIFLSIRNSLTRLDDFRLYQRRISKLQVVLRQQWFFIFVVAIPAIYRRTWNNIHPLLLILENNLLELLFPICFYISFIHFTWIRYLLAFNLPVNETLWSFTCHLLRFIELNSPTPFQILIGSLPNYSLRQLRRVKKHPWTSTQW